MRFKEAVHNNLIRAFKVYQLGEFPRTNNGKKALIGIFYQTLNGVPIEEIDEARIHRVAERLYKHSRAVIDKLKDTDRGALKTLTRTRLRLDVLRSGEVSDNLLDKVEIDFERAAVQLENTSRAGLLSEFDRLHGVYSKILALSERRGLETRAGYN